MSKYHKFEEKAINASSLYDYSLQLVEAAKEGWQVSEDTNRFPRALHTLFTTTLVRETNSTEEREAIAEVVEAHQKVEELHENSDSVVDEQEETEDNDSNTFTEEPTKPKRGRKTTKEE